jgi:hypothetical protein
MSTSSINADAAEHRTFLKHEGLGLDGKITPRCSCGWIGRAESESDDFAYTKVTRQIDWHLEDVRGLPDLARACERRAAAREFSR